jgi:membrane-associated protein
MFDWLTDAVTASPITYLVVAVAAGGDVLFPLIPSETIVITAGVLAAHGALSIWLIVPLAAVGAFAGDNASYWLGRKVGDPLARRLFGGERSRARLEWAERAIRRHGPLLVLVGRFVPGGRTASTFAAGMLELRYARFALADAVAVVLWAAYAALLGYLGGSTFRDSLWKPLAVSLGIAALVGLATEVWRRVQRRRGRDLLGDAN